MAESGLIVPGPKKLALPPRLAGIERAVPKRGGNQGFKDYLAEFLAQLPPEIPNAVGWKLIVMALRPPETTATGIHIAQDTLDREHHAQQAGIVLEVGPLAYQGDKFRDSDGVLRPWCRQYDWILFPMYGGQKVELRTADGKKLYLRIINDDEVLATTDNPGITLGHYLGDAETE